MIKAGIEKILSLGGYKDQVINGRTYANGPSGILPILPPKAETLTINTLTGIKDYAPGTGEMLHVVDHKTVNVISEDYSDKWLTRNTYLTAVHESPVFKFGQYVDVENFIIALQAMFVQDDTTALMLKLVGNIKDDGVSNFNDDGVTQVVTAKTGISLVNNVPVPNPVTLRPYRTFMEIEQPASTFVFRIKGNKGEAPYCALFEADGRMWRLHAIKKIREWLEFEIPGVKIIA
ncbi:MAG: hypothetical protein A4E71_02922 [Smithella sp. PtaU1.Bin162]|nr:MAG: hypothetical protein A4E71_02922 [Smithella sp. PtaU1.Bin162]